jgi:anti-anti-sigma regulatory factor
MLKVSKEEKDGLWVLRLTGSIDETTDFDQLLGTPPAEAHLYCKEVSRINSTGVKGWIKYFQAQTAKGTKIKFYECSPSIVQQINLIINFTAGGSVESLSVPFSCVNCSAELIGVFTIEVVKKLNLEVPDQVCTKCQGKALFDDIVTEYFGFITR